MIKLSKRFMASTITAVILISAIGTYASDNKTSDTPLTEVILSDDNVGITTALDKYIETLDIVATSSDATNIEGTEIKSDKVDKLAKTDNESDSETEAETTSIDSKASEGAKYPQFEGMAITNVSESVNIRESANTESEIVGTLATGGICVVSEKGDEWSSIYSGNCVGYIKNEFLLFGDDAGEYAESNLSKVAKITASSLRVRENPSETAECLTLVPGGESYEIISTKDGWVQIKVDQSLNGYVSSEFVEIEFNTVCAVTVEEEQATSDDTDSSQNEESNNDQQDNQSQQDNQQQQEPTTEPQVAPPAGSAATDLVNYALQFVGNPYVYGGNSLTNGTDCSGFVKLIFQQFGYSLPRTADVQATVGIEVSLPEIQAGDLLFYGDSSIGHVALYIGNGQVVHASSSTTGIIISNYNYRTPCKAVRIIY